MKRSLATTLSTVAATIALACVSFGQLCSAAEWPMLGRDGTRNSVSPESGAPVLWNVEERHRDGRLIHGPRSIRWSAPLGLSSFSSPVVSEGLVWIGSGNMRSGVKNLGDYQSLLKCFRVRDGKQVYEFVSPKLANRVHDPGWSGLGSSPLVEGDRLWITTNRAEVLCLDIGPLIRGEGEPRELWKLDLVQKFDVFLHMPLMGPPRPCSIGPTWNGRVYVTVANGVAEDHITIPKPNAPCLVCLNKDTGEVLWKDNSPGANILTTQVASPTIAEISGRVQVIVPQSDGWVRAFDPEKGAVLWEFDVNPKASVREQGSGGNRNDLFANAVVYDGRVYLASGRDAEQGEGPGRLVCIDPNKRGDISSEIAVNGDGKPLAHRRMRAFDPATGEKVVPNPNSALVWEFLNCGREFEDEMHRTVSSVAVSKGLVIAADFSGLVHCFDAKTGKRHWKYDTLAAIWGTPLIVDDKVYVGDEDGNMMVFQLGADSEDSEPIATISHPRGIYGSPVYADGTLYVPNRDTLFAVDAASARTGYERQAHWPQWRGPQRDNRSSDAGLRSSWPAEGPPLVWRIDGLGDGIASLAVTRGRIFTSTTYGAVEYAVALDESTGERLWATQVGSAVRESPLMRWLSQRTPTIDGNRVYVFTNNGWLVCLEATTGLVKWRISYPDEFGRTIGSWGYCDRPLVDGDKLICTAGGSKATIAALDKHSGKLIWKKLMENPQRAGYAGPLAFETDGLKQYLLVLEKGIASFAADDGRLLWQYDRVSSRIANSYTPLVLADGLLCCNGYSTGIARVKLKRKDDEIAFQEQYLVPQSLDPFEDSTMLVGDHLFAFGMGGIPSCFQVDDGKSVWAARGSGSGKAAATYADGHLYVRWADGTVALVEANPKAYAEKGHFELPEARNSMGATFPVVAGGRLYVRDNDRLYCYDVAEPSEMTTPAPPSVVQWTPPAGGAELTASGERVPNAIFVPTPQDVVAKMLAVAKVGEDDVVYDLGSGDGRIVIEAAKRYQCRAVGIELDPALVALSRQRAKEAKVDHLVTIKEADLFSADFSEATVVAVYLYPGLLNRLYPKLRQLSPGARIVSHQFEIPNYPPEATFAIDSQETGAKHTIYLWTSETPAREIRRIDTETQGAIRLAVSLDGSVGASAGTDGTVRLWNLDTGKESKRLIEHTGQTYCVAISPDGRLVATGGEDKKLLIWDVETGNRIRSFTGHENNVCGVAFSADGKRLASGSWDKTIRVWDVETGKETTKLLGHTAGIMGVAFSPDGKRLVSAGGEDLTLRLWDLASAETIHKLEGHTAMVRAVDFSPDGQHVLSGAYKGDGSARLWDSETGKQVLHFGNIPEGVHGVAYAAAGRRAIIAGADRAELWDLETGMVEQSFVGLTTATDAVFLPDGKHALLASYGDKTLRLWRLPK